MKRKILLVENLLLSSLPLIILIHLFILYRYYPPTNDRVEANSVSQHFSAKIQNTTQNPSVIPSGRLSRLFGTLSPSPWCGPRQRMCGNMSALWVTAVPWVPGSESKTGGLWWGYGEPWPCPSQRGPLFSFWLQPHATSPRLTWIRYSSHFRQTAWDGRWTGAKS